MFEMIRKLTQHESPATRADDLFEEQQREIYIKTDKLFARLMFWQWIGCTAMAIIISPYTWAGQTRAIHIHVWASIFLGGAISLFPIWLTRAWPGAAITRYVIAVAQMLMSALLISVTGGRIETHFHVFGSLVILSFYRDWRILIPATIIVGLDHFIRGIYWPYSVYGVLVASPWRSIEHAAWVVFEDVFLVISCFRSINEMRSIANRTAALESSEQNFRQIFQEAPIGMAVVGLDEKFLQANAKLCQMIDYTEDELRCRTPLEITHADDIELSREIAQTMLETGIHHRFEKRYVRKDGEIVWATRTGSVIRDENGNPRHFIIMIEDISKRKQAEEALHKSKRDLEMAVQANQTIMDNSLDVICSCDEEGRFLTMNAACEGLWGYTRDELIGRKYIEFVAPEDRDQTLATEAALTKSGKVTDFVNRYLRKDGTMVDVLWSATWSDSAKTFFGIAHDVTERRKAEEAIRDSEERYRLLFESNPYPVWVYDPETLAFLAVNKAAVDRYGYSREEFLAMTLKDIRPERDIPALLDDVSNLSPDSESTGKWQHRKKDGAVIDVEIIARAISFGGKDARLVLVNDITERLQNEKDLNEAKNEADRANRAKSDFLSRMSHELRTPLNAILGFGQLLEKQKSSETQKQRVSHIMNAGRHLLKLINEILDIARVESGRFQLSLEPVLAEQAVDEAISLMRPLAAERKIEIERTALLESSPHIRADRQRLKQVLLNLLANAVKYNRRAGRVIVDLAELPDNRFRISIIDEGPGIPPDKRARLFSPFDRLGAENSDTQGTGLGLALSKRLTEAMGGSIGEGGPAMGACFWIEFPIVKGVEEQLDSTSPAASSLKKLDGHEKTLLYIEDNLSNLSLIEHLFGDSTPIKLISAMQGKLGVELAARHQPDLILLDVHLPDINGADVLARLKSKMRTRDIPVVVLSADATKSQITRLMSLGAEDYLTKPLDVDRFLNVIEEHFSDLSLASTNGDDE